MYVPVLKVLTPVLCRVFEYTMLRNRARRTGIEVAMMVVASSAAVQMNRPLSSNV